LKLVVAAIQMPSEPINVTANRDRADALLREAHLGGAHLAVLPEMFNTGYGLLPDYTPIAEGPDGPTLSHLRRRSGEWKMAIAGGFVERDGHHLYDSLAFALPDGQVRIYRKRHLVFWERFRFRPGFEPLIVPTPWGRVGFAVCADMIYRRVWDDYRDRIDLAVVAAAWPEFACRETGRKNWLLGHIGPMSREIPRKVASDLGIPVVFANQCGPTRTTVPLLGIRVSQKITDRFAGQSCVCDGRHGVRAWAETEEQVVVDVVTIHPSRGPKPCRSTSRSGLVASSSVSG
jgi:N-carbamoylputrescine amidase